GPRAMTLRADAWAGTGDDAARVYPLECCGLLLGREEEAGQARLVVRARPTPNEHGEQRRTHFLIGPTAFLRAEREADAVGLSVLGRYHSHPAVAARPAR